LTLEENGGPPFESSSERTKTKDHNLNHLDPNFSMMEEKDDGTQVCEHVALASGHGDAETQDDCNDWLHHRAKEMGAVDATVAKQYPIDRNDTTGVATKHEKHGIRCSYDDAGNGATNRKTLASVDDKFQDTNKTTQTCEQSMEATRHSVATTHGAKNYYGEHDRHLNDAPIHETLEACQASSALCQNTPKHKRAISTIALLAKYGLEGNNRPFPAMTGPGARIDATSRDATPCVNASSGKMNRDCSNRTSSRSRLSPFAVSRELSPCRQTRAIKSVVTEFIPSTFRQSGIGRRLPRQVAHSGNSMRRTSSLSNTGNRLIKRKFTRQSKSASPRRCKKGRRQCLDTPRYPIDPVQAPITRTEQAAFHSSIDRNHQHDEESIKEKLARRRTTSLKLRTEDCHPKQRKTGNQSMNEKQRDEVLLICSEDFVESYSATVRDLTNNDRVTFNNVPKSHKSHPRYQHGTNVRGEARNKDSTYFDDTIIYIHDTDLLESCQVDIELPGNVGVLVASLVDLSNDMQRSQFIESTVNLVASCRYRKMVLFLCHSAQALNEALGVPRQQQHVLEIQNALFFNSPTCVSFNVVGIATLPFHIHCLLAEQRSGSSLTGCRKALRNRRLTERVRFLLEMVSALSLHEALWLMDSGMLVWNEEREENDPNMRERFHGLLSNNCTLRKAILTDMEDDGATVSKHVRRTAMVQLQHLVHASLILNRSHFSTMNP